MTRQMSDRNMEERNMWEKKMSYGRNIDKAGFQP